VAHGAYRLLTADVYVWVKLINLLTDLKEERDVVGYNTWVTEPMMKILVEFETSRKKYPPIKAGTPDPYVPPK
jgi:hypothetical protein